MKCKMVLLIALFCFAARAVAQTGKSGLDPSFANGGVLVDTSYTSLPNANDLKLRPDGKIIVLNSRYFGTFISQYFSDGRQDSSFGTNGSLWIDSFAKPKGLYGAVCELQQDEKILIAGTTYEKIGPANVWGGFVVRLNPNGTIDSAFGRNGVQYSRDQTTQLCLKPDGGILTAGEGPNYRIFINGFDINGAVDSAFGINGLSQINSGSYSSLAGLSILANGQIAAVGRNSGSILYIRLLVNGQPDTTFCGNGVCYSSGAVYCRDAVIFADGKVLVTLGGLDDNSSFLARLKADATPDSTFGIDSDGILAVPGLRIIRVLQIPDGRIVCAGMSNEHFAIARVLKDGMGIDSTFGNRGIITTSVSGGHYERIYAAALQPDGKILAGGICRVLESNPNYWHHVAGIVRYLPDASLGIMEPAESAKNTLIVYPNPAKTLLTVVVPAPGILQMFSLDGKLLKEEYCTRQAHTLEIDRLQYGAYLLLLKTAETTYRSLFMKE